MVEVRGDHFADKIRRSEFTDAVGKCRRLAQLESNVDTINRATIRVRGIHESTSHHDCVGSHRRGSVRLVED